MNPPNHSPDRLHRLLQTVFVLLMLASLGLLVNTLSKGLRLNSDLLFMLPSDASTLRNREIHEHVLKNFGTRFILGIEARSSADAEAAAELILDRVKQHPQYQIQSFEEGLGSFDTYAGEMAAFRFGLLSSADKKLLEAGKSAELFDRAQQSLYGFDQQPRWLPPAKDPLNLFGSYLAEKIPLETGEIIDDYLILDRPSGQYASHYAFIFLRLASDTFDIAMHDAFLDLFNELEKDLSTGFAHVRLIRSGLNFHVAEASGRAKKEISLIAVGSTITVIGLFLLAFGSVKPLLFGLSSILIGTLPAFVITTLIFKEIHLFTLVFGASLIGVAVDYSLHHIILLDPERGPEGGMISSEKVRSASFLGMVSTIIAYSFLTQSSLPGLQQIATFSMIGLAGAWLFVVVGYPVYRSASYSGHLSGDANFSRIKSNSLIMGASLIPHGFWAGMNQPARGSLLAAVLLGAVLLTVFYATPSGTASVLHRPSPQLIENEMLVQELLKAVSPNQYFIVQAGHMDELISEEKKLSARLEQLIQTGGLENYEMLASYFPSINEQINNHKLLKSVYGENGWAFRLLDEMGAGPGAKRSLSNAYVNSEGNYILPEKIEKLTSAALPHIWLKPDSNQTISIVYLRKVRDKAALERLAGEMGSVTFVDKVEELNSVINQQFDVASLLLLLSIPVICLLLILWHRQLIAGVIMLVPLASGICSIAILTMLQTEITLFHIFGLYLVLGLGLDYAIFVYHAADGFQACFKTVFLSSATSCASFGLLSLSSTPMVSAFGLTIFIGSVGNAIFSPLLLHLASSEA